MAQDDTDWLNSFGPGDDAPQVDATDAPDVTDWLTPADPMPAIRQVVDKNPDEAAKHQKMADQTGIPVEAVAAAPDVVANKIKENQVDILTTGAPVTRQFLSDPKNAAVAHDEAGTLAAIEKQWQITASVDPQFDAIQQGIGAQGLSDLWRSIGAGVAHFTEGLLNTPQILSDIGKRALDRVLGEDWGGGGMGAKNREENGNPGVLEFLTMLGGKTGELGDVVAAPKERQNLATQAAEGGGQLAGQIALAIGTGGLGNLASTYGLVSQGVDQMDKSVEATGKKGTGEGDIAVLAGAGVTVLSERLGLEALLNKIPGATKSWVMRSLLGLTTEAASETLEQVGQNLVLMATVDPDQKLWDGVVNSGEVGGIVGAIASALIPGRAHKHAVQARDAMDEVKKTMEGSALMERDPNVLVQHFAAAAQAQGVTDFYIPTDKLIEAYAPGKAGAAAYDAVAKALGVPHVDVQESALNGTDMRFTPEQFAKSVLMSDQYKALADDVRQNAGNMSVNEAAEAQDTAIEKAMQSKPAVAPEQVTALKDAGFTEEDIAGLSPEDVADLVGTPEETGKAQEPTAPPVAQAATLAESQLGLQALFTDAKDAGMTEKQYQAYLASKASANDKSAARLQRRLTKEQLSQTNDAWQQLRTNERRSVEDEVNQEPAYAPLVVGNAAHEQISRESIERAFDDEMRYDQATGTNTVVTAAQQFDEIKSLLPKRTDGKQVYVGRGGVDLEVFARRHGFSRGIDLLNAWIGAEDRTARIDRLTDQRMQEKHNDLGNQKKLLEAAMEETHSDQQAAILATEVNQLAQAKKEQRISQKDVRRVAKVQFSQQLMREAIPDKFFTTAARFGREAGKLIRKGNRAGAVIAKYRQLMNFQMAREAYEFRAQQAKDFKFVQKVLARKDWSNYEASYVEKVKDLLSGINFRPDTSSERLNKWLAKRAAEDGAVISDATLRAAGVKKNFKDLTVGEWTDLMSAARNLMEQGREAKLAIRGREKIEINKLRADLVDTLTDRALTKRAKELMKSSQLGILGTARNFLAEWHSTFQQMEAALRHLDGNVFGGIWQSTFFQPVADAEALKNELIEKHVTKGFVAKLEAANAKADSAHKLTSEVYVPELGMKFSIGDLVGMLAHMGSFSNLESLVRGGSASEWGFPKDWTIEGVNAAVQHLTPEYARAVQSLWDGFEAIYPRVAEIHRNQFGEEPKRVEPRELTVGGVKLRGGYMPLKYDSERSRRASKDEASKTSLVAFNPNGTVFAGMTKGRTGDDRPVDIHLNGMLRGFYQSVHYIAHFDAVRSARKVINSRTLQKEIRAKVGNEFIDHLDRWIDDMASGQDIYSDRTDRPNRRIMNYLAGAAVRSVIGLNAMTVTKQLTGIAQSISALGQGPQGDGNWSLAARGAGRLSQGYYKYFMSLENPAKTGLRWATLGVAKMAENPNTAVRQVFEKSPEMRDRIFAMDRETEQRVRRLEQSKLSKGAKALGRAYMWPIRMLQFYGVDMPTWIAAYNQGLAYNLGETKAIAYADQTVRVSQSSGATKDLAAAQRGDGPLAAFTRLNTYNFLTYNQVSGAARDLKQQGWKQTPAFVQRTALSLIVPAIAAELLTTYLKGGGDDDDEDAWANHALRTVMSMGSSVVPTYGPWVASAISGFAPSLSIVDGLGANVAHAFNSLYKAFGEDFDDDEKNEKLIENSALAVGALLGQPVTQARKTMDVMLDDDDHGPLDYIFGADKK